jgi:hypothetical protein
MLAEKYANAPDYIYGVDCPNTAETIKVEPVQTIQAPKPNVVEAPKNLAAIATEKPMEEAVKPNKPYFEIVVDGMDNIDPRALGKLMIELMDKVDLTIIHGDENSDDIVCKLCAGLGIAKQPLRCHEDGLIYDQHIGKNKLTSCQAGQKPTFEKVTP